MATLGSFLGLMDSAWIRVLEIKDEKGNQALKEGTAENSEIRFPHLPENLEFARKADFSETPIFMATEPFLFFNHTGPLQMQFEFEYVLGIHVDSFTELMWFAQRWQALTMVAFRKDRGRVPGSQIAPPPVLLNMGGWFHQRGVIKECSVAFNGPWMWEGEMGSKTMQAADSVLPNSIKVKFSFLLSNSYGQGLRGALSSQPDEGAKLIQLSPADGSKAEDAVAGNVITGSTVVGITSSIADIVKNQVYRNDILTERGNEEQTLSSNFKGFYSKHT